MSNLVLRKNNNGLKSFFQPHRGIDSVLGDFWSSFGMTPWHENFFETSLSGFSPRMDISEDENQYMVSVELPGLDEKDVEISLKDEILTIKGEKKTTTEEEQQGMRYSERCYGTFQRQITVGNKVNHDEIAANFKNGILTVSLPKSPEAQSKKIEVTVE